MEINKVKESNSLTLTTIDVMNSFNSGTNSVSSLSSSSPSISFNSNIISELEDNLANQSGFTTNLDSCLSNDFFSLQQIPSSHSLFDSFSTVDFVDLNDDLDCLTGNQLNGLRQDASVGTDLCLIKDIKCKQ
jgi:hypothetical protein